MRSEDWQLIETAPKDGTWLLLYIPEGIEDRSYEVEDAPLITMGRWGPQDMVSADWYSVEGHYEFWDYGGHTGAGTSEYQCIVKPTHWQPIEPPHPISSSGESLEGGEGVG